MNPHDPAVRPGAHLVFAELGVESPMEVSGRHSLRDPMYTVGGLVATTAYEVDDLHADLTLAARSAIESLEPVSRGKAPQMRGLLGAIGPQLELLAARRDTAYRHLTSAVSAYRQLLAEPARTASKALGPAPERASQETPSRGDDWTLAGERQVQALRVVERGGLRLKQSALSDQDRYLSDGTGVLVPVWAQTVERMLADGLLHLDTTTAPTQGQLLSLTPLGQEALRAADDAAAAPSTAPESASRDAVNPTHPASSDPAVEQLPTREELLALEEIKRGRVLLKERACGSGLRVEAGSGARMSSATVEAMQERGWIERDTTTTLAFGQQLSLTGSGEAAFHAGCAQGPRTTAALSRSIPTASPSSPAEPPAAGSPPHKPSRSR